MRLPARRPVGMRLAIAALALWTLACAKGRAAEPPAGATRIVSLAPSLTEALFAIGAGQQVVGRSRFCDYPPEARALPVVGDLEPDLEAILALRPDLVVAVSGLSSGALADKLAAHGLPTWFADTSSLAEVDRTVLELGRLSGHARGARQVVEDMDAQERAIERAVGGKPRPRVLLVVSLAPVVVAGPKCFADELIRRAGGANVVVEGGSWPTLGLETIAHLDPDIVLDGTLVGSDRPSAISADAPGWNQVRAVRERRVVVVRDPRVFRAGPRIPAGLAVVARVLHPDAAIP